MIKLGLSCEVHRLEEYVMEDVCRLEPPKDFKCKCIYLNLFVLLG